MSNNPIDTYKKMVGEAAAALVEPGMVIGLGTGSTAAFLIRALAERLCHGLQILGAVPTSSETTTLANSLHIPLVSLDRYPVLDLAIDGADEIDPQLNLTKGAGGALLREKVVASAARQFVVIGDTSKLVSHLGEHFALPVEIVPFAMTPVRRQLESLGASVEPRMRAGQLFITDNQNIILDCRFPNGIADPASLQAQLCSIAGIVEHGLFLGMAQRVLVAGPEGVHTLP
ncbi:MAG: ribose-5-phosphate isomerase RpiA [Ktedonobacteraceae bacterium]